MQRQGIFDTPFRCLYAGIQSAIYGGCALPTVLGIGVLCFLREGLNSQLSAVQAEMSGLFSLFLTC